MTPAPAANNPKKNLQFIGIPFYNPLNNLALCCYENHFMYRCNIMHDNVFGVVCDGVGQCPPTIPNGLNFEISWTVPPGFPEDECRAQCSNRSNFMCTVPLENFQSRNFFELSCNSSVSANNDRG